MSVVVDEDKNTENHRAQRIRRVHLTLRVANFSGFKFDERNIPHN